MRRLILGKLKNEDKSPIFGSECYSDSTRNGSSRTFSEYSNGGSSPAMVQQLNQANVNNHPNYYKKPIVIPLGPNSR